MKTKRNDDLLFWGGLAFVLVAGMGLAIGLAELNYGDWRCAVRHCVVVKELPR